MKEATSYEGEIQNDLRYLVTTRWHVRHNDLKRHILIIGIIMVLLICGSNSVLALETKQSESLTIAELNLEDGMIYARVILPETGPTGSKPIIAGLFVKDASCSDSRLISWGQAILTSDSKPEVSLYGHIPPGLGIHTITLQAGTNMNEKIPTLCASYVSSAKTLELISLVKNDLDINSWYDTHTSDAKSNSQYIIEEITIPSNYMWINPGSSIKPEIVIKNTGDDDTTTVPIQVHAYLGESMLIPEEAQISPMAHGERKKFTLSYSIPSNLEYGMYDLTLVVDPNLLTGKGDGHTGGGKISLSTPDDDSFIGCEACWAKYR